MALLLVLLLAGCNDAPAPEPLFPDGPVAGVALSPRNFDRDFTSFFREADEAGDVLAWGGTIDRLADPDGGATVTATEAAKRGMYLFIQTSPFRQHDGSGPGLGRVDRWIDDLVDFVETYEVAFMALGVEVNFLNETAPEAYAELVQWYPFAYTAVKQASPDTMVFPTFQFERMRGHHGGLWGGQPNQTTQWHTIRDFPQSDMVAFTTYPDLVFQDPDDIPDDYYDVRDHVRGRKAFTEIGWSAARDIEGWESDEAEQAAFVDRFFDIAPAAYLTVWPFLYDQGIGPPFDSMGLRGPDGTPRLAHARWLAHTQE